ncbi:MAG TPA: shikimate dehydrogenase [Sphingomicrobium sp.]
MQPDSGSPYAEVIGDPIAHSKSPLIHKHWLVELGIAADYRATRVPAAEIALFLQSRRSDANWRGCNVTIPHKETVLPYLDHVDGRASIVGAVNTIVRTREGLAGYNTDVDGIGAALGDTRLDGRKAAVIGAGGGARAALAYLGSRSVSEVGLLARNPDKARHLESIAGGKLVIGSFSNAGPLLNGATAIINASPLGMVGYPEMSDDLLAAIAVQSGATRFDMVYSPLQTRFLSAGQGPAVDGLTMLIGQAARAFELFFGQSPPRADARLRKVLTDAFGTKANDK